MTDIAALIRELVAGNRILANEGVVDAWGHISVRNPDNPNHYFLSRSRSPELVEPEDIMEFDLENRPIKDDGRPIYIERPIHGAIYAARPDVMSVAHNHCPEILPFAITAVPMRPAVHSARRLGESSTCGTSPRNSATRICWSPPTSRATTSPRRSARARP